MIGPVLASETRAMPTTLIELAHALSLMRRTREACAARLEYTKAVWHIDKAEMQARHPSWAAPAQPTPAAGSSPN